MIKSIQAAKTVNYVTIQIKPVMQMQYNFPIFKGEKKVIKKLS